MVNVGVREIGPGEISLLPQPGSALAHVGLDQRHTITITCLRYEPDDHCAARVLPAVCRDHWQPGADPEHRNT